MSQSGFSVFHFTAVCRETRAGMAVGLFSMRAASLVGEPGEMKAMILAAGLGTRLRPLTDDRPKALVEIAGRTLLEITLSRLRAFGVREFIINVHYRGEMIVEYLKKNANFGM